MYTVDFNVKFQIFSENVSHSLPPNPHSGYRLQPSSQISPLTSQSETTGFVYDYDCCCGSLANDDNVDDDDDDDDDTSGYYTMTCDRPCPQHCPSGRCDRTYGHCICTEPGLFGPGCDRPCPPFMYGINCESHCRCREDTSTGCDPRVGYILISSLSRL